MVDVPDAVHVERIEQDFLFLAHQIVPRTWRIFIVEVVVADGVVLPAHRVVQRVHPGVAPVTIQAMFGQGGLLPASSNSVLPAAREISVLMARASATAIDARRRFRRWFRPGPCRGIHRRVRAGLRLRAGECSSGRSS
jgi:hypothetical protein